MFHRQPDMITYLEVWLSAIFVSRILLDLLAMFNILLNYLPYVFYFLYHSLGVFLTDSSISGQGVVNGMPVKGSSGFISTINEKGRGKSCFTRQRSSGEVNHR